jgi:penicillin-binding protein 1C
VIKVGSWKELPPRMRRLGPTAIEGAPRIAYPPPDARLELGAHDTVTLAASGNGTLHWLVNGRPIAGNTWRPDGAGEMRLAVVDDAGRSSAVLVRIVRRQ